MNRFAPDRPVIAVVGRSLAVFCGLLSIALTGLMFATQTYEWFSPDFSVFWTVSKMLADGRLTEIYDPVAVTKAHSFEIHAAYGLRPWVYPPTALPFVAPLQILPIWVSFGIWVALSAIVYVLTLWRVWPGFSPWVAVLALLSLPVMSGLNTGQTSVLVGAMAVVAISVLDRRPVLAAVLLIVAGAIKPTLLILTPVALIAGRHWRALGFGTLAGAALLLATVLLYGGDVWMAWIRSLGGHFEYIVDLGIVDRAVTPKALAVFLGLSDLGHAVLQIIGGLLGVAIAALVFARTRAASYRLVALVGGGLMVTPYAMHYDLAALTPAAAILLVRTQKGSVDLALAILAFAVFFPLPPYTAALAIAFTISVGVIAILRPDPHPEAPGPPG